MKIFVLTALVCVATGLRVPVDEVDEQFKLFKQGFGRNYQSGEESARRAIFEENYNKIVVHNRETDDGVHTYRLGVNQFADMTSLEIIEKMNGFLSAKIGVMNEALFTSDALPSTVDWRQKGVVTPVKNQEQCGSCWAFSAVAAMEGQHALKTGKLVSLSEQNLVDCSKDEGNMGCEGGLMDQAFDYVKKNHGIDTEDSYAYKAVDEQCEYNEQSVGATITGWSDVQSGSESQLQAAVAKVGPISVAIDASSFSFQFYKSGVYDDTQCGNQRLNLDHGVTAVGYGALSGKDYWLVKNSWDTTWGDEGYILMSRNKDNQCGIATMASYPTGTQ